MAKLLFQLRVKLAWLIFPATLHYADIDLKTQLRKLALEEAAQICDKLAASMEVEHNSLGKGEASPCFEALAIDDAARVIRYRARHSDMFADELRRRRG